MMFILSLFLWLTVLAQGTLGQDKSIIKWAVRENKYQQWLNQVDRDSDNRQFVDIPPLPITVFIPTDEAFKKLTQPPNEILGSHIAVGSYDARNLVVLGSLPCLKQEFPKFQFSEGYDRSTNKTAVYVFDAKILESHKVHTSMVHIIDRVLNPPKIANGLTPPRALEWINYHSAYPSISVRSGVETFSSLINSTGVESYFRDCIACTFFVPENIESETSRLIDRNVLIGHIIPNHILFLRPMNNSTPYKTKANSAELNVELSKELRVDGQSETSFIYSTTKGSLKNIRLGNTRVKVTQGNIPVSNGVIHIIRKPLVITDMSVLDYLNEESQTSLSRFYSLIQQYQSLKNYYARADANRPLTLFAFTNEAFESVKNDIDLLSKNSSAIEELLKLHFVDGELITSQNAGVIKEKVSLAPLKKLYFSVAGERLYVEGDGVKAASVLQDVACTNGIIHVINKVLGIPSSPIKDKLREDPQLKTTFIAAEKMRSDWINKLGDKSKNFTFFAPSEAAWKKLLDTDPSSYKQLVDGIYADNTLTILNRHLVENQAISSEVLKTMSEINTVNSRLDIVTKGQPKITLKFMQLTSTIVRPDIKAINGYIHEIDTILMQDQDLAVSPSAVRGSASISRISPAIIILIAAYILKLF